MSLYGYNQAVSVLTNFLASPTVMTWVQVALRAGTNFIILGLILSAYPAEEANVWLLLLTLAALKNIADSGFLPTFSRMYSYARAGLTLDELVNQKNVKERVSVVDNVTLSSIVGTARIVYGVLAGLWLTALLAGASFFMAGPINTVEDPEKAWIGFVVFSLASTLSFYGGQYTSALHGCEKVALHQKLLSLVTLLQLLVTVIVILTQSDFVWVVVSFSAFLAVQPIVNAVWARKLLASIAVTRGFPGGRASNEVWRAVWPSAWRSGVGVMASDGVLQLSGLTYAQLAGPSASAGYLLALRIFEAVRLFASAPFQAHLPRMVRMRACGAVNDQLTEAQTRMRQSYVVFIALGLMSGYVTPILLEHIESETKFVTQLFWLIFLFAGLVQRYIGMHLQLYGTTNEITWHKVNTVTAGLFAITSLILLEDYSVLAFPLAYLVAQLGYGAWYAGRASYDLFGIGFYKFEKNVLVLPVALLCLASPFYLAG